MDQAILTLNNVEVVYDYVSLAIKGVSLAVPEHGIVALLGGNGAGKSTTLKSISGLLTPERGEVRRGDITFLGSDVRALPPQKRVRLGIAHVLEGRRVFEHLTPDENLVAGSTATSRVSTSAARRRRATCRAASSRCWRSDAPS
jgi:branched-chain amino acid transport system ATP-binding protein